MSKNCVRVSASVQQLAEEFDLTIHDDGSVWDPIENCSFRNIDEWNKYVNCTDPTFLKIPSSKKIIEE